MNNRLYARLAAQNMRKNHRFYLPYLLAIIGTAAGFYIVAALALDPAMQGRRRALATLQSMMVFGLVVIGLFTAIFMLYANSFLIKRRKKELGLYQILGMGRRHIAAVLVWETLYTALIGIVGGLLAGIALYKLAQLLLLRFIRYDVIFGLTVSGIGAGITAAFFAALLLFTLATNLIRVRNVKPIELMRGAQAGEREPRTRWLLTLLGIGTLGGGYWIAMHTADALEALQMYFVAVILVIVGTYCLFTAVSIAVLKLLRRNKQLYYRPNHFISVSGMLYRMKQNAVGLANICVLSTMVMVMVSGTVSLYMGTEQMLERHTPSDLVVSVVGIPEDKALSDFDAYSDAFIQALAEHGIPVKNIRACRYFSFTAGQTEDGFTTDISRDCVPVTLHWMTAAQYAAMTGIEPPEVNRGEVLVYADPGLVSDRITLFTPAGSDVAPVTMRVAGRLSKSPTLVGMYMIGSADVVLVTRDEADLMRIFSVQQEVYGDNASYLRWECHIDTDADDQTVIDNYDCLYNCVDVSAIGAMSMRVLSRAESAEESYALNGSFLFLGLFLGLVLIIATVLIIFYKQISEGYDDQARFEIMQKVGLSRREARRTISHQILMVFFLPLIVAALHMLFDFRMLSQLLQLFSITDTRLVALCSLATLGAFSAVYGAVYAITARTYYKIVQ